MTVASPRQKFLVLANKHGQRQALQAGFGAHQVLRVWGAPSGGVSLIAPRGPQVWPPFSSSTSPFLARATLREHTPCARSHSNHSSNINSRILTVALLCQYYFHFYFTAKKAVA